VPDHHSPEPLPTHIDGRSEEAVGRGRGIRNLLVDRHGDVDCGAGLSLLLGLGRRAKPDREDEHSHECRGDRRTWPSCGKSTPSPPAGASSQGAAILSSFPPPVNQLSPPRPPSPGSPRGRRNWHVLSRRRRAPRGRPSGGGAPARRSPPPRPCSSAP